MDKRRLGTSEIEVSPMGLGCWAIGGPFWEGDTPLGWSEVDDRESIRAIHAALGLGVTFFDTANVYGAGHSERVLGKALKSVRDEAVIATKFGLVFDEDSRQVEGSDASPEGIRRACEDSLRRLQTEVIDLYQFHLNDYDPQKAVVVRDTLEELVKRGYIRSYAWSTDFPERAAVFADGEHCVAVQHQLNVLDDSPEMLALVERAKLTSINRGPLAMGLLTGKFRSDSQLAADDVRGRNSPEWMQYFTEGKPNPHWLEKLAAIRDILQSDGRSLAQGALAWLWARSDRTLPIPGFKTVRQVEDNAGAMRFGLLSREQMDAIDALLDRGATDRDT